MLFVMTRLAYVFMFLVLILIFLLFLYESTSVNFSLRPNHKRLSLVISHAETSSSFQQSSAGDLSSSESSQEDSLSSSNLSPSNISVDSPSEFTNPEAEKTGPVQIIVLARMRTGSTLCGEILNQNPDLFFLFEPLHSLKLFFSSQDEDFTEKDKITESAALLRKLFHCKFPRLYLQDLARWGIGKMKSTSVQPICQRTGGCHRAMPRQFEEVCKKSGHVATKTIRANIKMLQPLLKNKQINLKVIHLIRDPRGTANSRRSYYSKFRHKSGKTGSRASHESTLKDMGLLTNSTHSKRNTIPKLCDWMRETLQDALKRPEWLKDRYKLVRYEDLARDPLRLSRSIYTFLGMEMPAVVTKWIRDNTEENDPSSLRQFSTHKNSTEAADSWRGKLSLEEVLAVQRICGDVMDKMGYKTIHSQRELDDKSLILLEQIDLGEDIMIT